MSMQPRASERTTVAIRDDVLRVTGGQPARWVTVHDIARRLGLDEDVVDVAVRRAIEQGWFVGDGEPPHSIRLSTTFTRQLN